MIVYSSGFASDACAKSRGEEHEPLEYCLHNVAQKIRALQNHVGASNTTIYLSHPVNFREQFYPEYKTNRDITHKPYWYKEIQNYLLEVKGAMYSELGDEADDALGIAQMEAFEEGRRSIIVSIDKDLDMIPGLHYNFSKTRKDNGVYEEDDPECLRLFYRQLIKGDSADNIPGLFKRKGMKATETLMCPLDDMTSPRQMWNYVLDLYDGDEDFLAMTGKLLWIKRWKGDDAWWEPPR